jgi:hypothetical protein
MENRIFGRPRFAGEALMDNADKLNHGLDLFKERSSIQANQEPGGSLEETRTEKFFERPD